MGKTVYMDEIRFLTRPSKELFYKQFLVAFSDHFNGYLRTLSTAKALFLSFFAVFAFGVFENYLEQKQVTKIQFKYFFHL